jgi:uncharacterized protein YjeT (DUF2065 family)
MKNDSIFTKHLHDADENYFEHLAYTAWVSVRLIAAGLVILIHGIFPFVFTYMGSKMLNDLHAELAARKKATEEKSRQG